MTMPWKPPKENAELKSILRKSLKDIKGKDDKADLLTSIRGDYMYVEIFWNTELLYEESEEVPDGEFDDVRLENKLLKRLINKLICLSVQRQILAKGLLP
jgi:hypothetical protein